MAVAEEFVRTLAGKGKPKNDALEALIAERKGTDKDDKIRVAYEKARKLYMPTINAALAAGGDKAGGVATLLTAAEADSSWDDWKGAGDNRAEAYYKAKDVNAWHKKNYETVRSAAMETVSGAMGMVEIGGGAVASGLAAADAFASAGKWGEATERIAQVKDDAEKVNARAPVVRACRRHQETIKAAFAITGTRTWARRSRPTGKRP